MNIMPQEVSDLLNGLTEPQAAVRCWACHRFMPASVGYANAPCEPCQRKALEREQDENIADAALDYVGSYRAR